MADYYHVAPAAARHLIEQEGITPWNEQREPTFPQYQARPYVHMWPDAEKARDFALRYADQYPEVRPDHPAYDETSLRGLDEHPAADIWHIRHDGPVRPDNRLDHAVMTPESIPTTHIRHHEPIYLSDVRKYTANECPNCGGYYDNEVGLCEDCQFDDYPPRTARIDAQMAKALAARGLA